MENAFDHNAIAFDQWYGEHFHSTEEIGKLLLDVGFIKPDYWQTLFSNKSNKVEEPKHGYGEGSFVVIQATNEIIEDVD